MIDIFKYNTIKVMNCFSINVLQKKLNNNTLVIGSVRIVWLSNIPPLKKIVSFSGLFT